MTETQGDNPPVTHDENDPVDQLVAKVAAGIEEAFQKKTGSLLTAIAALRKQYPDVFAQALLVDKKYEVAAQILDARNQADEKFVQIMKMMQGLKAQAGEEINPHGIDSAAQYIYFIAEALLDEILPTIQAGTKEDWRKRTDLPKWLAEQWQFFQQINCKEMSNPPTQDQEKRYKRKQAELDLAVECLTEELNIRKQVHAAIETKKASETISGRAVA